MIKSMTKFTMIIMVAGSASAAETHIMLGRCHIPIIGDFTLISARDDEVTFRSMTNGDSSIVVSKHENFDSSLANKIEELKKYREMRFFEVEFSGRNAAFSGKPYFVLYITNNNRMISIIGDIRKKYRDKITSEDTQWIKCE